VRTAFFLIGIKIAGMYNALVLFGQGMGLHNFSSIEHVLRKLAPAMLIVDAEPFHDPYVLLGLRIAGIFLNGLVYLAIAALMIPIWNMVMAPDPVNTQPGSYSGD
jgi:hypothetical protein